MNEQSKTGDRALYVFIDESGNFDFSKKGTKNFVLAGVATLEPLASAIPLQNLKYLLLSEGVDISQFHATEDKYVVRERVFGVVTALKNMTTHTVYGLKSELPESVQSSAAMHIRFSRSLISTILKSYKDHQYDCVVLVLDQAFTKRVQGEFRSGIKPELKESDKPFHIYFHSMKTDFNGQIADYLAWAKFKQLERGENRPWGLLTQSICPTEIDLT